MWDNEKMFYDFVFFWYYLRLLSRSPFFAQVLNIVRADKILPSESHFNTELIILLAALESDKIELLYLVQANDHIIVPVNIGTQATQLPGEKTRVALVSNRIIP